MSLRQPNVLIVFPDQMRGSAMGFLGEEPVRTPVLDGFAAESLCLDSAASNYPICSPYRAMLMTGRYPHGNGVTINCVVWPNGMRAADLRTTDRCWSDVLRDQGYSLGYIGKWHLDTPHEPYIDCYNNHCDFKWNEWCPPERRHGFDYWYAYGTYDEHNRPMYWRGDAGREEFHYVDQWGPEHEADRAIEYLRNDGGAYRDPEKPFALVVSMNPPHMPYDRVPDRYIRRYDDVSDEELCRRPNVPPAGTQWGDHYRAQIRNQMAMISGVDEQFGRILKTLDEQGLREDTIVLFTSDHGDCLGAHEKSAKGNAYEESMRIPFLIRWPGQIPVRRDPLLLSAPDVYPTLLGLLGMAGDIPDEVEGRNYAGFFRGEALDDAPSSQLYMRVFPEAPPSFGERGVRTARFTAVWARPDEGTTAATLLFDRREDPFQLRNVAEERPETLDRLRTELNGWLERTGDPWKKV